MQVHHYLTFPHGGAAIAAKRLHVELLKLNLDSRFIFSLNERGPVAIEAAQQLDQGPIKFPGWPWPISRWLEKHQNRRIRRLYERHLAPRSLNIETFSMAEQLTTAHPNSGDSKAHVTHLHWISYMADYPTFFDGIDPQCPLVWTLHDMNPFTGGCHFNDGCHRFQTGCGNCPQVQSPSEFDVSRSSFEVKQKIFSRFRRLAVVAPSAWMLDLARRSGVWPRWTQFEQIPYGLDLEVFSYQEKTSARNQLQLPTDCTIVGFGADQLSNPRKGFAELIRAFGQCQSRSRLQALIFGGGELDAKELGLDKVHSLGFVTDERLQATAYAACDFFVVPSREDNQPQMALEAMACGTPVIGSSVGGIPEVVLHGETGWLFDPATSNSLSDAIDNLAQDPELRQLLASNAMRKIAENHSSPQQAKKYSDLYADL
ncbi:MAG: glycosyltransferase [Pirellulaceae bacterium]|nr:glycosyltransferase [Pirellulaceae bacterium]